MPRGIHSSQIQQEDYRKAAVANAAFYDAADDEHAYDESPHIKHATIRARYTDLLLRVFDQSRARTSAPRVLDLGAGEGSVTLPLLELGARVVAVDIAATQLELLKQKTSHHADALETRCQDVMTALEDLSREGRLFDIVACNSFLHHVPDYLQLVDSACATIDTGGQFFSFQDPLLYASLDTFTRVFSLGAYFSWRIFQGDIYGGLRRRLRRSMGNFDDSPEDNAEYHATRGGVDHEAIMRLLESRGFRCDLDRYFSTQSRVFQPAGAALKLENTFALLARRA